MTTYVLVHGAWHGAWCWDLLAPELAALGHRTVAVDLPCEDRDASFDDYAEVILEASRPHGDASVLVAHSLGGISGTKAALRHPFAAVVYLCGVLPPVAGMPHDGEPRQSDPEQYAALVRHEDGSHGWEDPAAAITALYEDCPDVVARDAFARLRRQQTRAWELLEPLPAWPEATLGSVVCAGDRIISPEWSRWAAAQWLGVEAVELPGSHSPMLSRPAELARVLAAHAR